MHTAGKFFIVVNLFLTVAFLLYTADVIDYRNQMLRKIKVEEDKIPGLEKGNVDQATEKLRLQEEITLTEAAIESRINEGLIMVSAKEAMIAHETDSRNDRKEGGLLVTQDAAGKLQERLKVFQHEIEILQQEIGGINDQNRVLAGEVSTLETRFADTKTKFENAKRDIYRHYEILRKTIQPAEGIGQ